jgi:pantoate--beta-alanine ligase
MGVEVVGVPTVREPDGVACSSRNIFLRPEERAAAPVLHRALVAAEKAVTNGTVGYQELEKLVRGLIEEEPLAAPDLVAVRDAVTLEEYPASAPPEAIVILLAVRFGRTRLLDERVVKVPGEHR